MAVQSTTLHTDTAGKSTSAVYATDADGTDRWYLAVRIHGLEQAEDAPHTTGDAGIMPLAVRRDTAAASSGTTGDYEPLQTDALGRLRITGPVLEDAAAADGDAGFPMLAVRRDTAAAGSGTTGDYEALQTTATGALRVRGTGIPGYPEAAAANPATFQPLNFLTS